MMYLNEDIYTQFNYPTSSSASGEVDVPNSSRKRYKKVEKNKASYLLLIIVRKI
jgi:hypothetical protein